MSKKITLIAFILFNLLNSIAQPFLENSLTIPKENPDTLYFAFNENDIQLIIIDSYDTWNGKAAFFDAIYPRGGSWAFENPAPRNIYLFRNKDGEIIKTYNSILNNEYSLKSTNYINTNDSSLYSIQDYRELNNHLMFYGENDKVGLINLKGEVVLPANYDMIRKFQNGKGRKDNLIIVKDGFFGLLDSKLNELFPPIYSTSKNGSPEQNIIYGQYIRVFKNGKCGIISENGDILIDFLFDEFKPIHDSLYIGLIYKDENEIKNIPIHSHWDWGYKVTTCILFDKDFIIKTELKNFDYIYYWGIKRFIVKKDNKFGVLNHKGEVVIPLEYDNISSQNGNYFVYKGNKCGLINLEGKIVLPIEFNSLQFYGQAIYVTQEGLIGVYNDKYKLIAKPQFKFKTWEMGKYILTREDGSKGFVMHKKEGSYYQSPEGEIIKL